MAITIGKKTIGEDPIKIEVGKPKEVIKPQEKKSKKKS